MPGLWCTLLCGGNLFCDTIADANLNLCNFLYILDQNDAVVSYNLLQ